jgi:hypothetical protein
MQTDLHSPEDLQPFFRGGFKNAPRQGLLGETMKYQDLNRQKRFRARTISAQAMNRAPLGAAYTRAYDFVSDSVFDLPVNQMSTRFLL